MRLLLLALSAALAAQPALSQEARPSEQSIRQLLELTQAHKLLDTSMAQVDSMMHQVMDRALAGNQPTTRQQQIVEDFRTKVMALYKDELKWETFEPMMIGVYQSSFTQHEVDGMTAFYRSKAGKAVIAKMPTVLQETMQVMRGHMSALMPKVQELQTQMREQLQAAKESDAPQSSQPPQSPHPAPAPPQSH